MALRTTEYGDDLQDRNIGFGAAGREEINPCKFRTFSARRVFLQLWKPPWQPLWHQSLLWSVLLPSQTVTH